MTFRTSGPRSEYTFRGTRRERNMQSKKARANRGLDNLVSGANSDARMALQRYVRT